MTKQTNSSNGIGVLGALGVLFVALKLLGLPPVAEWSWWWVTLPFWGGIALVLLIVLGIVIYTHFTERA